MESANPAPPAKACFTVPDDEDDEDEVEVSSVLPKTPHTLSRNTLIDLTGDADEPSNMIDLISEPDDEPDTETEMLYHTGTQYAADDFVSFRPIAVAQVEAQAEDLIEAGLSTLSDANDSDPEAFDASTGYGDFSDLESELHDSAATSDEESQSDEESMSDEDSMNSSELESDLESERERQDSFINGEDISQTSLDLFTSDGDYFLAVRDVSQPRGYSTSSSGSESASDDGSNSEASSAGKSARHDESLLDSITLPTPASASPFRPIYFPRPLPTPNAQTYVRHPSPSDAALFKCRPRLDHKADERRGQILGEKSGKPEFFAARETNRAHWAQRDALDAPQSTHEADRSDSNDCTVTMLEETGVVETPAPAVVFFTPDDESKGEQNMNQADALWATHGKRFIENPRTDELPPLEPTQSQDFDRSFDMTSAYAYQQSKRAADVQHQHMTSAYAYEQSKRAADVQHQNTPKPHRRLPIQDLLAKDHRSLFGEAEKSSKNKRSFEEAFTCEIDICTQPAAPADISAVHALSEKHLVGEETSKAQDVSPVEESFVTAYSSIDLEATHTPDSHRTSTSIESARPSKRLRLAQAAACMAIGGAAAFSLLVNTAPVF